MGVISGNTIILGKSGPGYHSVGPLQPKIDEALTEFQHTNLVRRLWSKDPTVWHHDPAHQEIIRMHWGGCESQRTTFFDTPIAGFGQRSGRGVSTYSDPVWGSFSLCPKSAG